VALDADDRLFLNLHRRLASLERRCKRLAANRARRCAKCA
jgi:hypothetical protein